MAISVNMLRLRFTSDCQPRTKNGQPAQSTTGVASSSWSQFEVCCREHQMVEPGQMPAHLQRDHRKRQREADPEPARHVDRARGSAPPRRCTSTGSSAMPQIGQEPGPDLPDLGVHRAGVDRALRDGLGLRRRDRRVEIARRVGQELRAAAGRAEIVGLAAVLGAVLGRVRVDRHAAHRVLHPMIAVLHHDPCSR